MIQSTGGTTLENSRHDNLRNRKKNAFETKTSPVPYISDFQIIVTLEKQHYLKTKQNQIAEHHLQTNHCKDGDSNALPMCNYHRQTDWAKHSLQASSPIGGVARGHAKAARETRREYEKGACNDLK